ncbi:hypothetical protein Esti_002410 [Eimeria stiedai]
MNKSKQLQAERPLVLPKRQAGHRRSSLALFFRGEELLDSDDAQANQRLKPKDQLQLSPEELRQRVPTRTLCHLNPRAPQNITRFSYKDNQFKKVTGVDQTVVHLSVESTLLLRDSVEAAEQEELLRLRKEAEERRRELEAVEVSIEDDGSAREDEGRVMRNQFNNVDRATHIKGKATIERSCATMPPPKRTCYGSANRWIICDAYIAEVDSPNRKEGEVKKYAAVPLCQVLELLTHCKANLREECSHLSATVQLLERVVSFNAQQEAYRKFQTRDEEAAGCPQQATSIWELRFPRAKGKDAMALKWNPQFHDLLAVGYGNYDYLKQGHGYVCCFSLKNTSHPEYSWKLDSKVCSLDWHPLQPSLLCVGLYDGNVAVLDATSSSKRPWHSSNVRTGKHLDPVWDVRWEADSSTNQPSFFSVSADGHIMRWTLLKSRLESEGLLSLKWDTGSLGRGESSPAHGPSTVLSLATGLCFDFCPIQPQVFVVGTEEGAIFKCSKAYSGQFLTHEIFSVSCTGHDMPVNSVQWSPFNEHVFLSASADWRVMLWDDRLRQSIATFDYGTPVSDIAWSPYSATQFLVLTTSGVLHVHDLSQHRRLPTLSQKKVCADGACARLCFNAKNFVLAVGEAGGKVSIVKLSPKVLTNPERPAYDAALSHETWQAQRLDAVLLSMSEDYRLAANPRDRSLLTLQRMCQADRRETPQPQPADD